jgi:prepilin-type N-terminal cleavage/methylation domain-containing protein
MHLSRLFSRFNRYSAFTLVELLVVMAIIGILSGLVLGTLRYVEKKVKRNQAQTDIASMSAALERYKIDNGSYPLLTISTEENPYPNPHMDRNPKTGKYRNAARLLFFALSGKETTNFSSAAGPVYLELQKRQIDMYDGKGIVVDPFKKPYGYTCTTDSNEIMNVGFFDLWSTCDTDGQKSSDTNEWITNWDGGN